MSVTKFLISIITLLSLMSCVSIREKDYYDVINLVLEKGENRQDSIFLPEPFSKKEFKKRKKEKKIHNIFKVINLSKKEQPNVVSFLKNEAGININKEEVYFKKQIKKYKNLDTSKIKSKKIKYLPRPKNLADTLKYSRYKYVKHGFILSKPVFTKNSKYALIDYFGKIGDGGIYILLYHKKNGQWIEKNSILYLRK